LWASVTTFDSLGLTTSTVSNVASTGTLGDPALFDGAFGDSQLLVWHTSARDISQAEYDQLESWLQDGGGLIVTGLDALSNSQCYYDALNPAGDDDDDDDSAGDDDDSAGDDDDSAGDDDDSAAGGDDDDDCSEEVAVSGGLLADLVRSTTAGDGPQSNLCGISDSSTPVTSGPWGNFSTAFTFTSTDSNHESAVANSSQGAVRVAAVGNKAKVLYTEVLGGGKVIFWNGDGPGDWATTPDVANLIRNGAHALNFACGGSLQGGDCDDSDATLYPGTCP
ncbi:MAG: hypothetical protein VX498_14070, partial [Myxococcota bacterium]|nr:hypothetical protein [Myxococcota bacterium]